MQNQKYKNWKLDLGAGNILNIDKQQQSHEEFKAQQIEVSRQGSSKALPPIKKGAEVEKEDPVEMKQKQF